MNGEVFQCREETNKPLQFTKTVNALHDHVTKTFKYAEDVVSVCLRFELTTITSLNDLTDEEAKSAVQRILMDKDCAIFMKRKYAMASNLNTMFTIAWGQCSPKMQAKLVAMTEYEAKSSAGDCIWLLNSINSLAHLCDATQHNGMSLDAAWATYFSHKQGQHQSVVDYVRVHKANIKVVQYQGGKFGLDGPSLQYIIDGVAEATAGTTQTPDELRVLQIKACKESSTACTLLRGADKKRFAPLLNDLANQYTRGQDTYPTTLTVAVERMWRYG